MTQSIAHRFKKGSAFALAASPAFDAFDAFSDFGESIKLRALKILSSSWFESILPAPDSFATPPPDDVAILEHYAGTFQSVYISLNPFIDASRIGTEQFKPGVYPSRQFLAKNCRPVPRTEVIERTGLPSIAAIDVGLRTSIHGLKSEFSNLDYATKIESLAESSKILPPRQGSYPDVVHDSVLSAIQSLGYQWVWVGDEFGTERKLHWIGDLKNQDSGPTIGHCNVFTPDKALLWTTHWDSHFSFLCSSERNLNAIEDAFHFEGFFCDMKTVVYWSLRPQRLRRFRHRYQIFVGQV